VQTVTGSAVDNTDPLNPVVNLGSSTTPTLQEVTTEGNITDVGIELDNSGGEIGVFGTYGTDQIGYFMNDAGDVYIKVSNGIGGVNTYEFVKQSLLGAGVGISFGNVSYFDDKITVSGVSYPLPNGASSQIATLADITGGGGYTVVSANQTAVNDTNYTVVANATFTDPSPTEGKGYVVYVRNGTATIGGTGYGVGSLVFRVFHSGAWSSREYKSNLTASDIPTGVDATKIADGSVSNTEFQYINSLTANAQTQLDLRVRTLLNDNVDSSSVTGVVANTILKSYLVPANTLSVGDTLDIKTVCSKTGTNATANFRIYTNTSNSLSGASPLALVVPASNNIYFSLDRTYTLKSGNTLESFPVGSTATTDEVGSTASISNTAFNPTVDNYIIIAIQPNSASDSFKQTLCYITHLKAKTTI
jgi:hypothetical protein